MYWSGVVLLADNVGWTKRSRFNEEGEKLRKDTNWIDTYESHKQCRHDRRQMQVNLVTYMCIYIKEQATSTSVVAAYLLQRTDIIVWSLMISLVRLKTALSFHNQKTMVSILWSNNPKDVSCIVFTYIRQIDDIIFFTNCVVR